MGAICVEEILSLNMMRRLNFRRRLDFRYDLIETISLKMKEVEKRPDVLLDIIV